MENIKYPEISIQDYIRKNIQEKEDSTLLLTEILNHGVQKGFHRQDVWKQIIILTGKLSIQKKWSHWASLNDREEIRLRLKAIHECGVLDESLIEFILFFFRASDPVLYQLSSMIIGREMANFPELQNYFISYCTLRKIPLDTPIRLNNQRSRRRALLVLSAEEMHGHKRQNLSYPLALDQQSEMPDSDISITFLSCSLLLKGGSIQCKEFVEVLLKNRFRQQKNIRDRSLIRNTGLLITELKRKGENAGDYFHHCFDAVLDQYHRADQFSTKLQALFLLDELMETSIHLGLEFTGVGSDNIRQGKLNQFLKYRFRNWAYSNQKPVQVSDDSGIAKSESITDQLFRINIHENPEEEFRIFAESIHFFSDSGRWRSSAMEERSYRAFFLIDFSIHSNLYDSEELMLLFESNGLIEQNLSSGNSKKNLAKSLLSPVIKRMMELEPSISRTLFDPQLIHRLSDHEMIPALIPTGTDPDFLPILADAAEHQIRLQLAVDPSFNPDIYLYLLTIRRPGTRFYRDLLELCSGREYKRADGSVYPFQATVEMLLRETSYGKNLSEEKSELSPFWRGLNQIRLKLEKLAEENDPVLLLQKIENEVRGTGAEYIREGITIHDLLEIVQPSNGAWYRAGLPTYTTHSGRDIFAEDQKLADLLNTKLQLLEPETLDDGLMIGETIQSVERLLFQLRENVLPVLGMTEANLFERCFDQCNQKLHEWEIIISDAVKIWNSRDKAGVTEAQNLLFNKIIHIETHSVKDKFSIILMETFIKRCNEDPDPWLSRYELLLWAAASGGKTNSEISVSQSWNNSMINLWQELAKEAMENKAEARLVQLIRAKEFSEIRRSHEIHQMLKDIKTWCMSRYDLYHAIYCNKELYPDQNLPARIIKTSGEYFGHYARVWLALLVGVIFMFDFGDPWTELAEIGDVGGVIFAFVFGVAGTFLYVWTDLRKKTVHLKNDPFQWASTFSRAALFLLITFVFTALVVCLFWYMFSSTDQVVHGEYAPLHLLSWTGFALFAGVFLGLLGRE